MTPGSPIVAAMYATPPITRSAPTTAPIRSMLSTPFWNGMTTPPFATSGRIAAAALSVSQSLTAKQDDVGGREARRIVGDRGPRERDVTERAPDREPALAHRGEMPAARDERDVVPRLREPARRSIRRRRRRP